MSTAVDHSAPHRCRGTIEVLPRSCHALALAAATQLPRSPRGRAMMEAAPSAMHGQRHLQRGALSATLLPRTVLGGTVCESAAESRAVFFDYANAMLMHVHG